MADTQADSNVFSVRIVSIDYYMAAPISGLDFCYSTFQGTLSTNTPNGVVSISFGIEKLK
jgi:DNA polymerase zeta